MATGAFWLGMLAVFSVIFSGMVISHDQKYGPIGIVFGLMSLFIASGVVIILGAAVGLMRQDRGGLAGPAVAAARSRRPGRPGLTAAELRLLPMLASHLSFPEIAAQLFLSRHTVKSEAISIYRKLGASSRAQAVLRSRELGLLRGWGEGRSLVPSGR